MNGDNEWGDDGSNEALVEGLREAGYEEIADTLDQRHADPPPEAPRTRPTLTGIACTCNCGCEPCDYLVDRVTWHDEIRCACRSLGCPCIQQCGCVPDFRGGR